MQDEQVEQTDDAVEPTAEDTSAAETEGAETDAAEGADSGDSDVAASVDAQAAQSDGTAAEQAPEVPDDASATIARAQEHIDNLNMDQEREAAERTIKRT